MQHGWINVQNRIYLYLYLQSFLQAESTFQDRCFHHKSGLLAEIPGFYIGLGYERT